MYMYIIVTSETAVYAYEYLITYVEINHTQYINLNNLA